MTTLAGIDRRLTVLIRVFNQDTQLLHTQLDARAVIGHPRGEGDQHCIPTDKHQSGPLHTNCLFRFKSSKAEPETRVAN
uniref:Uncharacterized protein n=1 Tax=Anguilla anguilla TaxID=7936 RepID=A0A0E9VFH3_ANGAN